MLTNLFHNNENHAHQSQNSISLGANHIWMEHQEMLQRKAVYEEQMRYEAWQRAQFDAAFHHDYKFVDRYLKLLLAVNENEKKIFRVWGNYDTKEGYLFSKNCGIVLQTESKFAANPYLQSLLQNAKLILISIAEVEEFINKTSADPRLDTNYVIEAVENAKRNVSVMKFNFKTTMISYFVSKEGLEKLFFNPYFASFVEYHKKKNRARWDANYFYASLYYGEQNKERARLEKYLRDKPYIDMWEAYQNGQVAKAQKDKVVKAKQDFDIVSFATGLAAKEA